MLSGGSDKNSLGFREVHGRYSRWEVTQGETRREWREWGEGLWNVTAGQREHTVGEGQV